MQTTTTGDKSHLAAFMLKRQEADLAACSVNHKPPVSGSYFKATACAIAQAADNRAASFLGVLRCFRTLASDDEP